MIDNSYNPEQLDILVNEIEGRLNDFESGGSDKEETIKSFAFLIGECVETAVKSSRLDAVVKPTGIGTIGLLKYIPTEPMELPDNGAIQNKYGVTASGVKVLNELREILIKAGY